MLYTAVVVACLYDVHGNLPALEAVLEDARGAGAERFALGGDYALFGPWPAETVARLRELEPALWIRGERGAGARGLRRDLLGRDGGRRIERASPDV